MAAYAAGIFHHQAPVAAQALTGNVATPMSNSASGTNGTGGSSGDSSGSATISANDFLTLLVTEMQNQDPTADTDPNEYINQLVQVNSLEQLININQTLSTDLGGAAVKSERGAAKQIATGAAASTGGNSGAEIGEAQTSAHKSSQISALQRAIDPSSVSAVQASAMKESSGNLSIPEVNRAAQRVGHSLDGRSHAGRVK